MCEETKPTCRFQHFLVIYICLAGPPRRAPVDTEYQLSMTDDDPSLPPQNRLPARPPNSSSERKASEISEPGALASGVGQPPRQMKPNPFQYLSSTLGVVGNPSNQNPQGGRVVPSAGDSHSEASAGYTRLPSDNGRLQAQPSDDSSSDGPGNQNYRFVANNGASFEKFPAGIGGQAMGSCNLPTSFADSSHRRMDNPVLAGASLQGGGVGGVHLQATSSESSSDCSKVLADGEHSMPNMCIPSGTFGSREPVLPARDMTMELFSRGVSGASQGGMPSFGNDQRLLSSLEANASSAVPSCQGLSVPPASSGAPATDRWAPSDCPSTEMQGDGMLRGNVAIPRGADAPLSSQPRSLEDTAQRPAASKIPRRHHSGDIAVLASSTSYSQSSQSEYPASTLHHSLPSASSRNTIMSQQPQQPASATASAALSPGSTADATQSTDSFNMSGLASINLGQNHLNDDRQQPVFAQCEGEFVLNPRSADAFEQQDYQGESKFPVLHLTLFLYSGTSL